MPVHKVAQGECISSLACRFGLTPAEIFDHPANAKLRAKRKNPDLLFPGDDVYLPDPERREEVCQTGRSHRFVVQPLLVEIRVVLQDIHGDPYPNRKFTLTGEGVQLSGKTDGSGLVQARVPATLESVMLAAWLYDEGEPGEPDIEYELQVGHLDPEDTVSGMQSRLNNLGYRCSVTGEMDEETRRAAARYRMAQDLAADEGDDSPAFRSGLAGRHEANRG